MSLFQSNLRKQLRKLPKILKSVKIVHYFSLSFIRVLRRSPLIGRDGLLRRPYEEVDARPAWVLNQNPGFVYSVLLSQGPWSPFRLGVSTVYVTLLPPQSALVARCLDPIWPVNR